MDIDRDRSFFAKSIIQQQFFEGKRCVDWKPTCSRILVRIAASKYQVVLKAETPSDDGVPFVLIKTMQQAKRWVKIVVGFTLLALGVLMIVTPGPGWLIILLGLGILAAEFVWARTLLDRLKEQGMRLRDVFVRQPADPTGQ